LVVGIAVGRLEVGTGLAVQPPRVMSDIKIIRNVIFLITDYISVF
jgi:hypothetical protein